MFGLVRAIGALGQWNGDMSRHARERQHPVEYLRHSCYENWLAGLEKLLVETGLVTAEELASGKVAPVGRCGCPRGRILEARKSWPVCFPGFAGNDAGRDARPDFAPETGSGRQPTSDRPYSRALYVRGRAGVIHEHPAPHLFPDLSAEGVKVGRHLYCVRFEASELWGENATGNSAVYVDLWEDYLEPA